jgi:branched-chain amino acid aminotransferase
MIDCKGTYFIKDGHLFPIDLVEVMTTDAILIYEIMRVVNGGCLFVEDHYKRLVNSAKLAGIPLKTTEGDFLGEVQKLIQANEIANGNIKILVQYGNGQHGAFFYFIPHAYPTSKDYLHGVKTDFLLAERNLPHAKTVQQRLRDTTNQMIQRNKIFEVILVNSEKQILEGSRTNIFFVKGNEFYTPPTEFVLPGITRQKVMECLAELKFNCFEKAIDLNQVATYDAVFLTGTSPKVLPVSSIGKQEFETQHQALRRLMESYDAKIEAYIENAGNGGL